MTKRKKRKLKPLRVLMLVALVAILFLLAQVFRYQRAQKPVSKLSQLETIVIEQGTSVKQTLEQLEEEGLIQDATMSYFYARQHDLVNIKAGTYQLDTSWDLQRILTTLNDPKAAIVDQVKVTIVEGQWAKEIAAKISAVTNVSTEDLLQAWNDAAYVKQLQQDYPFLTDQLFEKQVRILLEGYLYPDTYYFYPETDVDTITRTMLNRQLDVFHQLQADMNSQTLSIHQLYTLASIVQYESGKAEDMAKIAQVFYNRLHADMALQSSVTVCYALDIDREVDNWKACEVNPDIDSPYNTYKYKDLPPGPILSPGYDALNAVLHPDQSMEGYFYFMADVTTGEVHYAKTYQEHQENVRKYDVVS